MYRDLNLQKNRKNLIEKRPEVYVFVMDAYSEILIVYLPFSLQGILL